MSQTIVEVMTALCAVTVNLPIGTNLALLHLLWMLLSGQLLNSRGALFPALQGIGLSRSAMRRAWQAMQSGAWQIGVLLNLWQQFVLGQPGWQPYEYEGYQPVAVDITAYWRPALEGCISKHYHPQAGKALQAVEVGLVGRVGQVNGQRVTLLTDIVRGQLTAPATDSPPPSLITRLLQRAFLTLKANQVVVLDAGFESKQVQAAKITRFVMRGAKNLTARRNKLCPYKGRGAPPKYGELVRPLARKRKGKTIEATPFDREETWQADGRTLRARFWLNLVTTDTPVSDENKVFHVIVIHDPRYKQPWVLVTSLKLSGYALWRLYQARWPIEQVPLVAKQTLGGAREFVSDPESCQRLPELNLLASEMLTYLAATVPPTPTGFWDRQPKPTAGRLRRVLAATPFPDDYPLPGRFRKKNSVTDHLLKGVLGRQQQKRTKTA